MIVFWLIEFAEHEGCEVSDLFLCDHGVSDAGRAGDPLFRPSESPRNPGTHFQKVQSALCWSCQGTPALFGRSDFFHSHPQLPSSEPLKHVYWAKSRRSIYLWFLPSAAWKNTSTSLQNALNLPEFH